MEAVRFARATFGRRNGKARGLIVAQTLLLSWHPVVIDAAGMGSPFLFGAVLTLFKCGGFFIFLWARYGDILRDKRAWALAFKRLCSGRGALWILAYFDIGLMALAAGFINVSAVAIIWELNSLMTVLVTQWMFGDTARYKDLGWRGLTCFAVAVAGAGLVILSQPGGELDFGSDSFARAMIGAVIAFAAAIVGVGVAIGFRWGVDVAGEYRREAGEADGAEIFFCVFGGVVGHAIAMPVIFGIGIAFEARMSWSAIVIAAFGGLVIQAGGAICWRVGNLMADDLRVNAIRYALPALSLLWLFALGMAGEPVLWMFIGGVLLIMAANARMVAAII